MIPPKVPIIDYLRLSALLPGSKEASFVKIKKVMAIIEGREILLSYPLRLDRLELIPLT
jgi:hypothetical protein